MIKMKSLMVILLSTTLFACNSGSKSAGTTGDSGSGSPKETVTQYYTLIAGGKAAEAYAMGTKQLQKELDSYGGAAELTKPTRDETKHGGRIGFSVTKEEIKGDRAVVIVRINVKDGFGWSKDEQLVKENGTGKIAAR